MKYLGGGIERSHCITGGMEGTLPYLNKDIIFEVTFVLYNRQFVIKGLIYKRTNFPFQTM